MNILNVDEVMAGHPKSRDNFRCFTLPLFRIYLDRKESDGAPVEQPEVVDVLEAVGEGYAIPSSAHLHHAPGTRAVFERGIDDANRPAMVRGWVSA